MGRHFWVGCGCFSWGVGRGEEEFQGACCCEVFAGRSGSKHPCLCDILYVEQWRFRCSMSSGHHERGFLDPRTPWADTCDVSDSDNPSTCSHSYYMLYACYMSSSEPSSGSSGSVWIHSRVICGKQKWLCARTPCTMYRRTIFGKQNWSSVRTPCTLIGV
jgi:hypothetical protein